jgi:hypothetical protein
MRHSKIAEGDASAVGHRNHLNLLMKYNINDSIMLMIMLVIRGK